MRFVALRHTTALATIVAGLAVATPAFAQDGAAEDPAVTESEGDIIVTATRREERLVDVPIAVSAFSGETLEARGALDLTDIGNITPNTTLETSRATNSTLSAFIRGIGQQDPVSGFEQGVGIYLDDVYLNRPQAAVLDIYDVERIEVLRGPQGTLYGRNTIGGAVKYVTRELPDEVALKVKGTYGSYNQIDGILTASTPIGGDWRVGASVARLTRDGFGKNLTTGQENYDKDVFAVRGTIEAGGRGAGYSLRLSGDYTKDNSHARGGHRLTPGAISGAPVLDDVYDTRGGLTDPEQYVKAYGIGFNASADLSDAVTVKWITGWRKDSSASPIDFDMLPAVDVDVPGAYYNEQFSQEFQLQYDNGGALKALVGAYYLDAKADTQFDVRLFTTFAGLTGFTEADVDTETYAIFGDLTYDLTSQFSLSVGGRYTWDTRKARILKQNYLGGGSPVFGGAGTPFGAAATDFNGSAEFKKFTPRASISFQPNRDHNFYASYAKGFKGGGFDPRGAGSNAPDLDNNGTVSADEVADFLSFDPEQVDSYEIGYKGNLMGGALYIAAAGFYADYTDVQIPGSIACTVGGFPSFCGIVSNAGKATFKGFELETNARLGRDLLAAGDRFNFAGSLGYIDAQYDEYITNITVAGKPTPTDVADYRHVQNTPKWTASGTLSYTVPAGDGDIYIGTTASYRSKTYQFEIANPYIDQSGYTLIDASIVYTAPSGRWTLGLYGKNLADKHYKTSGYVYVAADATTGAIIPGTNGLPSATLGKERVLGAFYGNPRQVFVTATFKL